jgi:hypothetical protein
VRAAGSAVYELRDWLSVSASFGSRWIERGEDRLHWDGGLTARWKRLSLDIRYVDTNLSFTECGFSARCDATVIATLTLDLSRSNGRDAESLGAPEGGPRDLDDPGRKRETPEAGARSGRVP